MRQLLNCFAILTVLAVGGCGQPTPGPQGRAGQQATGSTRARRPSRRTRSARVRRTARSCRASGPKGRSRARAGLASRDRYGHRSLRGQ